MFLGHHTRAKERCTRRSGEWINHPIKSATPIRRSDPEGIEHHISGLCPEMMGIILSNPDGHRRQLKEIVYGVL
jgi:hypothetical protein